jgi:DNA repair exonuclease SbcCD nuclease subunit
VGAVVIAGAVFDNATTPDHVIRRTSEVMRAYEGSWVLLPGNHDPVLSESPGTRIERIGRPVNVTLSTLQSAIVRFAGRIRWRSIRIEPQKRRRLRCRQ